jgi:hypothetical protein
MQQVSLGSALMCWEGLPASFRARAALGSMECKGETLGELDWPEPIVLVIFNIKSARYLVLFAGKSTR